MARIGRNSNFHVKTYESMGAIGATGDPKNAYECGNTIGTYLHRYGFDIDFAPVADTHFGYASSQKTWEEMLSCEMVTFKAGNQWGCQHIMTAHISAPNVTGADIPATMSPVILQDKLRRELGYQNLIITDAMEMGAITQQYSNGEAAVGCIKAGVDIVLGPQVFTEAFDAVVKAVADGEISEQRIDESVRRILKLKQRIRN